jgi:hypothetical protein
MNTFVLASPRAYLQGAFDPATGIMSTNLRTLPKSSIPANFTTNFPLKDPYRYAPYSFAQNTNPVEEVIDAAILADQAVAGNNIVDWIYLELRNRVTDVQATVTQTRAALLQSDGDIVDIDGISPIYFKNLNAGSGYVLSVRHRNHLGISSSPILANTFNLGLATTPIDLGNSATPLFGTLTTNYAQAGAPLRNLLYAGNANFNTVTRYTGQANDKDYILGTGLGGVSATILNNVYNSSDVNLNRVVRYTGAANDKDFLLGTPLSTTSSNIRTQVLPN